jgi:hypothetical protein
MQPHNKRSTARSLAALVSASVGGYIVKPDTNRN